MSSFPGTSIAGGAGTFVLMPDQRVLNYGDVKDYTISGADIAFTFLSAATPYTYTGPSALYSQKVLNVINSIPDNPSSFYVVTALLPTYAILSLDAITGTAAGGDTITVTGVGFVDGLVANLGGYAVEATFISETSFSFVTPPGSTGDVVNLYTRNPDQTNTTLPNAFTYT